MNTVDEVREMLQEFPDGDVRVTLHDPGGAVYVDGAAASRPTLTEGDPYPAYSADYGDRPAIWISLNDGSGMYTAWPVEDCVIDQYGRLVLSGPKGRAVYVVQSP